MGADYGDGMKAVVPLAITMVFMLFSIVAMAAYNLSRPDTLGMLREAEATGSNLAAACYREGLEMGKLTAVAERVKEAGNPLPDNVKRLLVAGPTHGCAQSK